MQALGYALLEIPVKCIHTLRILVSDGPKLRVDYGEEFALVGEGERSCGSLGYGFNPCLEVVLHLLDCPGKAALEVVVEQWDGHEGSEWVVHARDKYQRTVVGIKNVVVRAHAGFAILLWSRGDDDGVEDLV